jgi:hypothetical protein
MQSHLSEQGLRYYLLFVAADVMVMAQVAALIRGPTYLMRRS